MVCPGDDFTTLHGERLAQYGLMRCKLHMMRVRPDHIDQRLQVWPAWDAIKVDDTEVGIAEGLNAGAWTVGVSVSGNAFGMSQADAEALAPAEFERRRSVAVKKLVGAGAHYVIDSVADLMPVKEAIEARLGSGERP